MTVDFMPLKYAAHINSKTLPETTDNKFQFRYIDISQVSPTGEIKVPSELINFENSPSRARRIAPAGSTIVSTVRTYLRAIARVPESIDPLVFSTGFATLETTLGDTRFLTYACQDSNFVNEVVARSTGVSYPAISPDEISNISIPWPAVTEQRRIADFLDDRVTRIDRIIAARRQQITHEDDAATALLADRLLTGTAVVPLRRFIQDDRMGLWGVDPGASEMNVRVARVADFIRSNFKLGDATTVRSAPVSHVKARTLVPGDVLLERSGGTPLNPVGCPAFVSEIDGPTVCSNFISRLRPDEDTDGRYLSLLLGALYATRQQEPHSTQTTGIQNLNPASYFSVLAPCPSFMNQKKISREVDTELHGIRQQQNDLGRIIALLEEYKQSLITAAVNGEFDVTAASTKVPG